MFNLTQFTKQTPEGMNFANMIDMYDGLMWGKAHRIDDDTFGCTQFPVTCKDYVVDCYYRESSYGYNAKIWSDEIKNAPFIYIVFGSADRYKHFLENIPKLLHQWEDKQGVERTKVYECALDGKTANYPIAVMEHDKQWMNNATAISIYYTILRLCATNNEIAFTSKNKAIYRCNEYSYYSNLPEWAKKVMDDMLVDVTPYLEIPEAPFKRDGFVGVIGHGQSGLFAMLSTINYYDRNPAKTIVNNGMYYQYLMRTYITPKLVEIVKPVEVPTVAKQKEQAALTRRRNILGQYV